MTQADFRLDELSNIASMHILNELRKISVWGFYDSASDVYFHSLPEDVEKFPLPGCSEPFVLDGYDSMTMTIPREWESETDLYSVLFARHNAPALAILIDTYVRDKFREASQSSEFITGDDEFIVEVDELSSQYQIDSVAYVGDQLISALLNVSSYLDEMDVPHRGRIAVIPSVSYGFLREYMVSRGITRYQLEDMLDLRLQHDASASPLSASLSITTRDSMFTHTAFRPSGYDEALRKLILSAKYGAAPLSTGVFINVPIHTYGEEE